MAQPHAEPGEIVSVRPLGAQLSEATSTAILKASQLEIIRVVLPAGKTMREHHTPGEITVQCLEGMVEFETDGKTQKMQAGDLIHLAPRARHALKALENASLLPTICLLPG